MAVMWFGGGLFFGLLGTWAFEQVMCHWYPMRRRFIEDHVRWQGYHLHHSNYGLAAWIASLACLLAGWWIADVGLFGVGSGIIAQHTRSERRVVFWDKS